MPDRAAAAPETFTATRHRCPFCRRSWSHKQAAAGHIGRCWRNPDVRSCKTCANLEPGGDACGCEPGCNWGSPSGSIPDSCAAGVDISDGKVRTGCPLWALRADCADCGDPATVAGLGGRRYCRVDAGRRMAGGGDVLYDSDPADGEPPRTETDCRGSGVYDCPCEADGPDGLCSCCRSGESNGSCVTPWTTAATTGKD